MRNVLRRLAEIATNDAQVGQLEPVQHAFCPRCSHCLYFLQIRRVWRCNRGHEFQPTDHSVARFQVPTQ